eukprot:1512248-Pyramimonas_sp.AAC.1
MDQSVHRADCSPLLGIMHYSGTSACSCVCRFAALYLRLTLTPHTYDDGSPRFTYCYAHSSTPP